jgi:hypothetical protein
MTKGKAQSKKKASSPTSTVADDTLPKCLIPGRNMQSTEPGALTWLHFDNLECRQLCRLFDATEVAQMEDRLIMAIAREAAPYFVRASSFLFSTSDLDCSVTFATGFPILLRKSKCFCGRSSPP